MNKKTQTYENHAPHFVPAYHYFVFPALLLLIAGAICGILQCGSHGFTGWLFLLTALIILNIAFFTRGFALKAQDRAIRAEESLRYFILSGKPVDKRVTMRQFIALRFASDEELVELANKAARENMAPKDIKKAIKNWRGDYDRT